MSYMRMMKPRKFGSTRMRILVMALMELELLLMSKAHALSLELLPLELCCARLHPALGQKIARGGTRKIAPTGATLGQVHGQTGREAKGAQQWLRLEAQHGETEAYLRLARNAHQVAPVQTGWTTTTPGTLRQGRAMHRLEEHHQHQEVQLRLKQAPHLLRLNRSKGGGRLLRKNYET
jgi:hypothetical protein